MRINPRVAICLSAVLLASCGGGPAAPVPKPVVAAVAPTPLAPKPAAVTVADPKPIPITELSFIVETMTATRVTGIDYQTWPAGTVYVVRLPWACSVAPQLYEHFEVSGVAQVDGTWQGIGCLK